MTTIDERLEALSPGESVWISCPTPYCSGVGGKCAVCGEIWSKCGCMYNELNCVCGRRMEAPWLAKKPLKLRWLIVAWKVERSLRGLCLWYRLWMKPKLKALREGRGGHDG